jgi:hypothetical protein
MNRLRKSGFIDYHAGDESLVRRFTSQRRAKRVESRLGTLRKVFNFEQTGVLLVAYFGIIGVL